MSLTAIDYDNGVNSILQGLNGQNTLVGDELTFTWANSSSANTQKTASIVAPTDLQRDGLYAISVRNPSSVTVLTIICINVESLGGNDRDCELARFSCPASGLRTFIIQGWFIGSNGVKLILQNDTILGGSDGFTAQARIRKV